MHVVGRYGTVDYTQYCIIIITAKPDPKERWETEGVAAVTARST